MNFHKFHVLTYSPWPVFMSFFSWNLFLSFLIFFLKKSFFFLIISLVNTIVFMFFWWRDVIYESMMGVYSFEIKSNLKMSMILFIFSEVMFFFGWFWAFFHNSLVPSDSLGSTWPPFSLISMEPFQIPFLNTCILLTSGLTITWAHHSLLMNSNSLIFFLLTFILGLIFTFIQFLEYKNSNFSISENSFGSSFFITTGFHGLHVLIGSIFIIYCSVLIFKKKMSKWQNMSVEFSIWYWHFVDVVWLFLFFFMYWWSF